MLFRFECEETSMKLGTNWKGLYSVDIDWPPGPFSERKQGLYAEILGSRCEIRFVSYLDPNLRYKKSDHVQIVWNHGEDVPVAPAGYEDLWRYFLEYYGSPWTQYK